MSKNTAGYHLQPPCNGRSDVLSATTVTPTQDRIHPTESQDVVISVRGLTVSYGNHVAVDDVSFNVLQGECFALLGTNGAGKTTIIETLQGHLVPDSGGVSVFGNNPRNLRAVRPRIGIMLQENGVALELTVRETVRLLGSLSGREDDVDRVLGSAGLTARASTRVAQLSGGERRRLDFASAVWGAPELVFLDEPTTGLDVEGRHELWSMVDELRRNGTTIVLITHYLEEVKERADHVVLMHRGRIHAQGRVADLVAEMPGHITFRVDSRQRVVQALSAVDHDGVGQIATHDLQAELTDLLVWARENKVQLEDLEVGPARLDEVFHTLSQP